jgi:GTP-binding protein
MIFVDLPGYGYAKVPQAVRKKWGPMVETFLSKRKTLKGVVVILDIRRIPKTEDLDLIRWLDYCNIASIFVITKTDKLSKNKQLKQQEAILQALAVDRQDLMLFSAKTRLGREPVWNAILSLINIKDDKNA